MRSYALGALRWALVIFPLEVAWELAHVRLYDMSQYASRYEWAYNILHCSVGDASIAAASFLIAAWVVRDADWPVALPARGLAVALTAGVAYTAASEWYHVYRVGTWRYAETMPLVAGIGLSPLLQWIVLPVVALVLTRTWRGQRG